MLAWNQDGMQQNNTHGRLHVSRDLRDGTVQRGEECLPLGGTSWLWPRNRKWLVRLEPSTWGQQGNKGWGWRASVAVPSPHVVRSWMSLRAKGNTRRALSCSVRVWLSSPSSWTTALTHTGFHSVLKTCQAPPLYKLLVSHSVTRHPSAPSPLFTWLTPYPCVSSRSRRSSWPST